MILATRYGDREMRMFEGSDLIPPPGSATVDTAGGGRRRRELAVTAVAAAVKLLSETIGGFVMRVYEGHGMSRRPVTDHALARLFQDPAEDWTSFELWSDIVTSLETEKHAFVWKVMATRGGVPDALIPMDPAVFRVRRAKPTAPKVIEARVDGKVTDVTRHVIHIRGWASVPGPEGVSSLDLHREPLHVARAYDEYRGRYFDNDAMAGIVLEHPGKPNREQRRDLLASWIRRHGGTRNANRPGIVWGGVKINRLTPTLRDAQAAELADAIARDVARAFRIYPAELLHAVLTSRPPQSAELWSDLFSRFSLFGRMRRIERAFASDRDLFTDWRHYPRFDATEFLRPDFRTLSDSFRDLVQVGGITPNEGRGWFGFEPLPGGDVLNWPPVGATSPAKGGGGATVEPADDDTGDGEEPAAQDPQED